MGRRRPFRAQRAHDTYCGVKIIAKQHSARHKQTGEWRWWWAIEEVVWGDDRRGYGYPKLKSWIPGRFETDDAAS